MSVDKNNQINNYVIRTVLIKIALEFDIKTRFDAMHCSLYIQQRHDETGFFDCTSAQSNFSILTNLEP